jgi:hypothetical protein
METDSLVQMIDHQRWLLNSGLVPDAVKNNLFMYGSLVHKDVQAVEVKINVEEKMVDYIIYVTNDLLKKVEKYRELIHSQTLYDMYRFKRLLKKEGRLDFSQVLTSFVADYCGPKWRATATVLSFDAYVDSLEAPDEGSGSVGDSEPDAR